MYVAEVKQMFYSKGQIMLHLTACFYRTPDEPDKLQKHVHVIMQMSDNADRDFHIVEFLTEHAISILKDFVEVKEVILWIVGTNII